MPVVMYKSSGMVFRIFNPPRPNLFKCMGLKSIIANYPSIIVISRFALNQRNDVCVCNCMYNVWLRMTITLYELIICSFLMSIIGKLPKLVAPSPMHRLLSWLNYFCLHLKIWTSFESGKSYSTDFWKVFWEIERVIRPN